MPVALPEQIESVIAPVFEAVAFDDAMRSLVPVDGAGSEVLSLVEGVVSDPALEGHDGLKAGLWLYVDELDRSHAYSQDLSTPTGSFWHAIMHRREGDFPNAKYWYRKAGAHPAMSHIDLAGGGGASGSAMAGYDPFAFVDRVERANRRCESDSPDLVALQRHEWRALFEWCAER
ncbi:MAG: hypothetical protein ACPGYV_13165 [Phycisphaeraceae bacterium]